MTPAVGGSADYAAEKSRLLRSLSGVVLEIGAGWGRNVGSMPLGVSWVGLEPDARLHARLLRLTEARGVGSRAIRGSAEHVPLPAASVDAVLSVTTLCSVDEPARALGEVWRVLRPGGRFVFAEHVVAASGSWSRRAQHLVAPWSRRFDHGCDPLRDTEAVIHRSALEVRELRSFDLPQPFGLRFPYVVGVAVR